MQIGSISVPCVSYMVEFNSVGSEISIINISDVRIQNRLCLFLLTWHNLTGQCVKRECNVEKRVNDAWIISVEAIKSWAAQKFFSSSTIVVPAHQIARKETFFKAQI